jgi:hypothetical protein
MKARTLYAMALSICTLFALTSVASAQDVQLRHDSKDSKSVPVTQEEQPVAHYLLEMGYVSQYNFRGTNLMPGSDGGFYYDAQVTIPRVGPGSLTMGAWVMNQIGKAESDSWSISEGGGGSGIVRNNAVQDVNGGFIPADRFPHTVQHDFREVDLFASYQFPLGFVDITIGNIAFFIHREAETFDTEVLPVGFEWVNPQPDPADPRFATFGPLHTVGNEMFDRIYIRLSTTKLSRYITPQITYYQTIFSWGDEPREGFLTVKAPNDPTNPGITQFPGPFDERNNARGGYLEGRVNGNFPIGSWMDVNPYALVSVSFRDRTEPVAGTFGGRPLTGFNHFQTGLEMNIHLGHHIAISPQFAYAYHISEPPIGTDRNEFWGGVKVSVSLP